MTELGVPENVVTAAAGLFILWIIVPLFDNVREVIEWQNSEKLEEPLKKLENLLQKESR